MSRLKRLFGSGLRGRLLSVQDVSVRIRCCALNVMTGLGMPESYTNCAAKVRECTGLESPLTPTLSPLVKGGEGREWGDSARAGICELWLGGWYYGVVAE